MLNLLYKLCAGNTTCATLINEFSCQFTCYDHLKGGDSAIELPNFHIGPRIFFLISLQLSKKKISSLQIVFLNIDVFQLFQHFSNSLAPEKVDKHCRSMEC